ncbi:integrase [Mesorhizobium loti]|uniref:integrase n=1 Tax=Rhizobium loti TaxID=381 RepID=UPI000AC7572C|nr:integrase [Mesorhizobium loti]
MPEPDEFTQKQSAEAIQLYTAYRHELDLSEICGRFMPYRWWTLPDPLGGFWMPYSSMLSDYAAELANIINDLTHDVHRLRAWARVAAALSDKEKLAVSHEFINTLGTVALGRPYATKSRFAFAAGHLCHQANRTKDLQGWRDEFPNERALYLDDIDPICRRWRRFRSFKRRVEPIAGGAFKQATGDFRNAYNHRFSSRFLIGMSAMVTRIVGEDGRICYGIGGSEPLNLDEVANLLAIERDHCYRAFEAFQTLVAEHCAAITAFDLGSEGTPLF